MSATDDEARSKAEAQDGRKSGNALATPQTVPRPSRPPPANPVSARPSSPPVGAAVVPRPASTAPRSNAPPTGSTPPGGRKGTLDGIHPNMMHPHGGAAFAYADPSEDDFDAEKTLVVDPDDAPTADYDPRMHATLDGNAGRYSSRSPDHRPPVESGLAPAQSNAQQDLVHPFIPGAPPAPTFDPGIAAASAAGPPRASTEGARRRTSRRTVKIPDDQIRRRTEPRSGIEDPPTEAMTEAQPRPSTVPPAGITEELTASTPVDGGPHIADLGAPSSPEVALVQGEPEFLDPTEEITIVRALRIISIGSDPPPPITSALATWPPPPSTGSRKLFSDDAHILDSGWTPAPSDVVEAHQARAADARPAQPAHQQDDHLASTVPQQAYQPVEAAPVPVSLEPPSIQLDSRPPDLEGLDISERISEIPLTEQNEILEDLEPDTSTPQPSKPKRPPPPPPKNRDGKADGAPSALETPPSVLPPGTPRPWWDDIFSDEYIRTMDRLDERTVGREVDFIEESLGMEKHAIVLDLGCGMGDHALELAGRGYSVVGLDYSKGMLRIADNKAKQRQKDAPTFVPPRLVRADMRELNYEEAFDGVYCWNTSFGYFDEEKNLAVLQHIHRALRQGGMFLLEVINRDYVAPRSPSLVWFEGQQCVCMDDMYVDFFTSRLRVKRTAMFEGGLSRELDYSIRLYTLHELGKLLHQVGFKVLEVTGHPAHPGVFFGTESPRLIVLSERS